MSTTSIEDAKSCKFWLALLAEFLGTFLLVLVACGSCAKFTDRQPTDVVQIALAFGLSVATIVWAIAHISGGHINPAVTVGFFVTRKISILRALLYVVVQTVGAVTGAGVLKGLSANNTNNALCTPAPSDGVSGGQVFGIEMVITFVLVFTVFATCDSLRSGFSGSGPLAIGLSLTMCHLWAVPYEGSGMNPARAFGPAALSGYLKDHAGTHAMYWLGPLLGGVVAGFLYDLVFAANASVAKAKALFTQKNYDDSQFDQRERRQKKEQDEPEAGQHLKEPSAA